MNQAKAVCVMGLGYVGLPMASLLATKGYAVCGVDTDHSVVATVNDGRIHIIEPDLDLLVKAAIKSGNLIARTEPQGADLFIIAVPTPITENRAPDLSAVEAAVVAITPYLKPDSLIIIESTSSCGATARMAEVIREKRPDLPTDRPFLAYCPERVLPGRMLFELVGNDRIVGGLTEEAGERAAAFYRTFIAGKILQTDVSTAEMAKLVENAYRDLNIAFSNELSIICDGEGIDVFRLIELTNHHPRVNILQPGPGVGGHCIAVDPWFIAHRHPDDAQLVRMARKRNRFKTDWTFDKIMRVAKEAGNAPIACLGLSYKGDIDDLRESPAVEIVRRLQKEYHGEVLVCEPHIAAHPDFALTSLDEALRKGKIIVTLVAHSLFAQTPAAALKEKIVMDMVGIFR